MLVHSLIFESRLSNLRTIWNLQEKNKRPGELQASAACGSRVMSQREKRACLQKQRSRMQSGSFSPNAAAWEGCVCRKIEDAEMSGKGD